MRCQGSQCWLSVNLYAIIQPWTVDHLARGSMKNAANCASTCELQDTWTSTFRTHIAVRGYYSWTTPDWGSCKQPDCLLFVPLPYITCGVLVTDVDGPYMPCSLASLHVNAGSLRTLPFNVAAHTVTCMKEDYTCIGTLQMFQCSPWWRAAQTMMGFSVLIHLFWVDAINRILKLVPV